MKKIKAYFGQWWCKLLHRANHDNYLNYASRRFFKCKKCDRLHSREAV